MTSDNLFDEIKLYLPQYLSETGTVNLFEDLKQFPGNINESLYTNSLMESPIFHQGEGISGLPYILLPNPEVGACPALIVSNTCDIDISNTRLSLMRLLYAPILSLAKYHNRLLSERPEDAARINNHIADIRNQRVSNIFYLPKGPTLDYEGIAKLDMIQNCPREQLEHPGIHKLFSLGDYGFYIFLFKISIHFTRIRERVERH